MFNALHRWFYPEPEKPFDCVDYTMNIIELCLEQVSASGDIESNIRAVCAEKYPHFEEKELLQLTRIIRLLGPLTKNNDSSL